ncbi:hypothetical protein BGX38DRAFT_1332847 [Terfezia claveryi]|nr:hypothetical protein BGX38DRAFT_1332847 [Terfezia claveryi]
MHYGAAIKIEKLIQHSTQLPSSSYTELLSESSMVQFWSKLLDAKYDKDTRKLTLAYGTMGLGGFTIRTHSLYIRKHYERLWSKICWGMSFSDNGVEGLYVPDDTDNLDLSTFNESSGEESFGGYIINGTPGIGKSYFSLYFSGDYRAKVIIRSCGMMVISGLYFIQMVVFSFAQLCHTNISATNSIGFCPGDNGSKSSPILAMFGR